MKSWLLISKLSLHYNSEIWKNCWNGEIDAYVLYVNIWNPFATWQFQPEERQYMSIIIFKYDKLQTAVPYHYWMYFNEFLKWLAFISNFRSRLAFANAVTLAVTTFGIKPSRKYAESVRDSAEICSVGVLNKLTPGHLIACTRHPGQTFGRNSVAAAGCGHQGEWLQQVRLHTARRMFKRMVTALLPGAPYIFHGMCISSVLRSLVPGWSLLIHPIAPALLAKSGPCFGPRKVYRTQKFENASFSGIPEDL